MLLTRYFQRVMGHTGKQPTQEVPSVSRRKRAKDSQTPPGRKERHLPATAISRRGFLGAFAATPFLLLPWDKKAVARQTFPVTPLCRCYIAGFQFHSGPAMLPALAKGKRLSLKREPKNPYDPLAIAVCTTSGRKIGYLPRRLNEIPATLMDQGQPVQSVIHRVTPKAPTWEMVEIQVFLGTR